MHSLLAALYFVIQMAFVASLYTGAVIVVASIFS